MKYEKPKIDFVDIAFNKEISSGGLSDWVVSNGYEANVTDHITSYVVNS